jgi:hypothetical protein
MYYVPKEITLADERFYRTLFVMLKQSHRTSESSVVAGAGRGGHLLNDNSQLKSWKPQFYYLFTISYAEFQIRKN